MDFSKVVVVTLVVALANGTNLESKKSGELKHSNIGHRLEKSFESDEAGLVEASYPGYGGYYPRRNYPCYPYESSGFPHHNRPPFYSRDFLRDEKK